MVFGAECDEDVVGSSNGFGRTKLSFLFIGVGRGALAGRHLNQVLLRRTVVLVSRNRSFSAVEGLEVSFGVR